MYDIMDAIATFTVRLFWFLLIFGIIASAYVAYNKKPIRAWLFPIIPFVLSFYWLDNPIKEGHPPTMTAMNTIPYWGLAIAYSITIFITKITKHVIAQKDENTLE